METQNKRTITIDLKKNTLIKKPKFIQNDTNIIEFIVQENGVSSDLTNVGRIVVNYLRPDKQIITKFIEDSKVANKVTYNLGVTETEGDGGVGEAELEITFYSIDNTQRISIKRMGLEIIDSIGEGTLNNNEDYTLLQELLVDVDTAITQAETATNNAQNLVDTSIHLGDYNSTTDYVVNNEVHYNGSTYRCILGSTGNEPTNTTYWTLVASKGEQGIQGVQGVQGEQGIQGERGLNWKGAYNNTITYIVNDGVSYNGSSYVCIQDTTAGILPTDTNYFNLLAQKGADGTGSGTVTSVNNISPDVSGDVILTANDVGALPIEDSHSHTNKSSLDRLGVDESNNLTIDDIAYESGASIDDVTPSTTTVWSSQKTSNEISVLTGDIGDKTTLNTTNKSNLVGAVNEVNGKLNEREINVKSFGAVGDGIVDDTSSIQSAIDELKILGGGKLYFPSGVYIVSNPIVLWKNITLEGNHKKTVTIKKTNTTTYTGQTGEQKNCVLYLDYVTGESMNFFSRIKNITIIGTQSSVEGIYMGNASQCIIEDVNIDSALIGISGLSVWMVDFNNIRVNSSQQYAFKFSGAYARTSLVFRNCYAEACGGGWNLQSSVYTTLISCGADYINTGGLPSNPYPVAGGNYQSESYIYNFKSSVIALVSCGCESSTAGYLYAEASQITFNSCYAYKVQNYFIPPTYITSFIGIRGLTPSTVKFNSCFFDTIENKVSASNLIRGIYIEDVKKQKIISDNFINITGFGSYSYVGKDGIFYTSSKNLIQNGRFEWGSSLTDAPFFLYNAGTYTNSVLNYSVSATKKRDLVISGSGSSAGNGTTMSHKWRYVLNNQNLEDKKVRLKMTGTYSTGGYGAPSIKLGMSDIFASNATSIQNISITGGILNYDDYITMPTILNTIVYIEFDIIYMGSSVTLSEFLFEVL